MDGHRRVAEQGLWPRGGNHHRAAAVRVGIADVVQFACGRVVLNLVVRERSQTARAPVDDVVAFVNETFIIEADKDLAHRLGQPFVHGEPLAVPVAGRAHALELLNDRAALLSPPLPDPLDELLTPKLMAGGLLCGKLPLHHILGGNARMVGARHPEGVVALHAVVARQQILQGVVEGVADVQHAGHIRRRNNDGKGRAAFLHSRTEGLVIKPVFVPPLLDFLKLVGFGQVVFGGGGRVCIVHGSGRGLTLLKER